MFGGVKGITRDRVTTTHPVSLERIIQGVLPFIGTSEKPIDFTPDQTEKGEWLGVRCQHSKSSASPHLTTTHVESAAHVSGYGKTIYAVLNDNPTYHKPMQCQHVQVAPALVKIEKVTEQDEVKTLTFATGDTYKLHSKEPFNAPEQELVVTRAQLEATLLKQDTQVILISFKGYEDCVTNWPYLTNDAVRLLVEKGVRIVGLNIPSMDREVDGGMTSNHKILFDDENRLIIELLALKEAPLGILTFSLNPVTSYTSQDVVACKPTVIN